MRKLAKLAAFSGILASLAGFWGCQAGGPTPTGIVTLRITDAPVDNPDIDGVWLTIGEVQYNLSGEDSGWQSFGDFVGPQKVNLLDYQNGLAFLLGSLVLPSGQYEQIRFLLEITDEGAKVPPATPGCFVSFKDGSEAALFVPSGLQTGYKAVGRFEVPANGIVNLTADFDLHKSLRLTAGGQRYLLQPTIRLAVDVQAGTIAGAVANLPAEPVRVFAYVDGAYTDSEAVAQQVQFPNSAASAAVDPGAQTYTLAFLPAGLYDLVVATLNPDTSLSVQGFVPDVGVQSGQTSTQDIDMLALARAP
jgi:hypothetical protein